VFFLQSTYSFVGQKEATTTNHVDKRSPMSLIFMIINDIELWINVVYLKRTYLIIISIGISIDYGVTLPSPSGEGLGDEVLEWIDLTISLK